MKKLQKILTIGFIIIIAYSCKQKTSSISNGSTANAQVATGSIRYTLNGYTYTQAAAIIQAFQSNPTIYHGQTSVYFNATVFHNMYLQLQADGADGFRVYFARVAKSQNSVVIVSTFDGGPNSNAATGETHQDNFENGLSYLTSTNGNDVNGVPAYDTDGGGATLYTNPNCSVADTCPSSAKDPHYITCKKAQAMVGAFVFKNQATDVVNGHSEWFDVNVIGELDAVLQRSPNDSGLRIYFATRTDMPANNGQPSDGFVIIVTKMIGSVRTDQYVCIPIHPKFRNPFDGSGGGTDNGEQCPTNCGGTTWP